MEQMLSVHRIALNYYAVVVNQASVYLWKAHSARNAQKIGKLELFIAITLGAIASGIILILVILVKLCTLLDIELQIIATIDRTITIYRAQQTLTWTVCAAIYM